MEVTERVDIEGRALELEVGKVAKQADGACLVRFGETLVLVTACFRKDSREGVDFLPLTVDYRESTYAGGRIPGAGSSARVARPRRRS